MCDLNTATVDDIAQLSGVTRAQAYDLQLWRPYATWSHVELVPGFDPESVAELRAAGAVLSPAEPQSRGRTRQL